MKNWLTALFIAGLICGAQANTAAAAEHAATNKPSAKKTEKASTPKSQTIKGKIKAIDKIAKTVTLEGESPKVVQITSETRITKGGKPATSEDLAVGEEVAIRAKESADGKFEALTIREGKAAAASGEKPAAPDKKKATT